ncbi:MAG: RNA pseudouridine synthase [Desulfobacterales bacterium]|nr:RNA pseudouridine synthase [Desulfobacterales bacterium]
MITINYGSNDIPLLAVGKGWLVVDKPHGMSVHNDAGKDLCSLVSAFTQREKDFKKKIDMDSDFGVNPVHRLDKETSGVILLSVNKDMFRFFSKQFDARQVKKEYIAILHGLIGNMEKDKTWGTWNWPLGENAGGRLNPKGSGTLQQSETRYRILSLSTHYTMVEIELLTGRKHQIRRHAKIAGHPVVGDSRYSSIRAIKYLKLNFSFDRLALHSRSITLQLPNEKKPTTIETPDISANLKYFFERDRGVPIIL